MQPELSTPAIALSVHSLTVPSSDPLARREEAGDQATLFTSSVWPEKVREGVRSPTLQTSTSLSVEPDAYMVSLAHATASTGAVWKVC